MIFAVAKNCLEASYGEACHRGKVREENQDTLLHGLTPLGELFLVADGIGGYLGGATASRMAADSVHEHLLACPPETSPRRALQEASAYANTTIHQAAKTGGLATQRMGSTVVMALLHSSESGNAAESPAAFAPGTMTAWIGHIGDSRAYLIREAAIHRITFDHTAVQEMLDQKLLTEAEALNHPQASTLTRSLGHWPEVELEIGRIELRAADALLLCSDGLWGCVEEADIAAVVTDRQLSPQTVADALLYQALAAGGQDNIGIIFIAISETGALPDSLSPPPGKPESHRRSILAQIRSLFSL